MDEASETNIFALSNALSSNIRLHRNETIVNFFAVQPSDELSVVNISEATQEGKKIFKILRNMANTCNVAAHPFSLPYKKQ